MVILVVVVLVVIILVLQVQAVLVVEEMLAKLVWICLVVAVEEAKIVVKQVVLEEMELLSSELQTLSNFLPK